MRVRVAAEVPGAGQKLLVCKKGRNLYFIEKYKFPKSAIDDLIEIEEWFLAIPKTSIYQLVLDAVA